MSIWTKTSSGWVEIGGGGGSDGLEGLGGWAVISEVTGSPKRYAYNDGGIDWVAFEWTDTSGTHSVRTDGGIVEVLMLGGAAGDGSNVPNAGGLHYGLSVLPNGPSDIIVGDKGTAVRGQGGKSLIGSYVAHGSGSAMNTANAIGVHSDPVNGPQKGIDIDFLGTGVLPYGYALTTDRRANSGSSWDNKNGADGVVIVRVPAAQAAGVDPGSWVTRIDYYAEVTDGTVTDTYQERFYGDDTVRTENGRFASPEQPDDLIPCDPSVAEGWTYADGEFTPPPPPPPPTRDELIEALQEQLKDLQKDT